MKESPASGADIPQGDFLKRFIGRRSELARLLRAWRLSRRGEPQFVALLADRGIGKTRLIHEFYRRISRLENRRDGGYWPDELDPNPVTLCINPRMSGNRSIAGIPWLWWGLRWHHPDERNAADAMPCALLSSDAQQALRPHVLPLLKKRLSAEKAKGAAKTAVGLGMAAANAFLPGWAVFSLFGAGKDVYETWKASKEWRDAMGDHEMIDFGEAQSRSHGEADAAAMDFLNAFLDASNTDVPTVPVILVLDDAQWADMVTLRFARQLFEHAHKRKLPLLIIATCWEAEWKSRNEALSADLPRNADPENLNVVFNQLERTLGPAGSQALQKFTLGRFLGANDLEPMLLSAFPGIAGEARDYLLAAAHGNPQQLFEMIKRLQAKPQRKWFEQSSLQQNLTASGLQKLRELSTTHEVMLEERVSRLEGEEPDVFATLTLGSLQGIRFYAEVTAAISERVGRQLPRGVALALARAEDPHNWISNFPGSFPASEFKESLGRKLFMACLSEEEATLAADALRDLLTEWFTSQRIEGLSERTEICLVLFRLLPPSVPADSELWALRCAVITRCIDWLYVAWRRNEAVALAVEFCAWAQDFEPSKVVAAMDLPACLSLPRALLDAHRYDASIKFAGAALARIPGPSISEQIALYKTIGKAESAREHFPAAVRAFEVAIGLARDLPENIRNLAGRLTRLHRALGSVLSSLEQHGAAFRECKKALRTLQLGGREDSPIQLRIGAQILAQISQELYVLGRLALAVRVQLRALELFEQCQHLGDTTPALLEQHALALVRMGTYGLYKIGGTMPEESVPYYQRALRLRQRVVDRLGETPGALSDLASSYSKLATGLLAIDRPAEARDAIDHALHLRREILGRVGDEIEALREFSLTMVARADVLRDSKPPDLVLAESSLLEVLEVRNLIIERWGPRQYDLKLLHYAWRKRGEIVMLRRDFSGALNMFSRARHTLRRLARVAAGEAEEKGVLLPEFIRLRHVCAEKLAEAREGCHQQAGARAALRFAMLLNYRLQTDFEPSKKSQEDGDLMTKFAARIGIPPEQLARDRKYSPVRESAA